MPEGIRDHTAGPLDRLIAEAVPSGIIDPFQIIHITDHHTEGLRRVLRCDPGIDPGIDLIYRFGKCILILYAGQLIPSGHALSRQQIYFLFFFPLVLFFRIFQTADHVLLIRATKYNMPHMGKRSVQNAPAVHRTGRRFCQTCAQILPVIHLQYRIQIPRMDKFVRIVLRQLKEIIPVIRKHDILRFFGRNKLKKFARLDLDIIKTVKMRRKNRCNRMESCLINPHRSPS